MSVQIIAKVTGAPAILKRLDALRAAVREDAQRVCTLASERVRARAVKAVMRQTPNPFAKPGRRGHVPSPPGFPPNADTGNLTNHIEATTIQIDGGVGSRVVSSAKYAKWLEYGTRRMAPRPYLMPEFSAEKADFERKIREAFYGRVRKFNRREK